MSVSSTLFKDYWQLRMRSAEQRAAAALELIEHKPARGTLAEEVVREIVDSFLPGRWVSQSGFIVDAKQTPSAQLDILIYDQLAGTALYRDANVAVLPTGARPVTIEVKSVMDDQEKLTEALANIASVKAMERRPREVVGIVYAFRGVAKPETLHGHLRGYIERLRKAGSFLPEHLPDMICLQKQNLVVVRERTPRFRLVAYQSKDPVMQSLLTQILNRLRVPSLYSILPKPAYEPKPLFEIR